MNMNDLNTSEKMDQVLLCFIGIRIGQDRIVQAMMLIFSGYLATQLWPASAGWVLAAALAYAALAFHYGQDRNKKMLALREQTAAKALRRLEGTAS